MRAEIEEKRQPDVVAQMSALDTATGIVFDLALKLRERLEPLMRNVKSSEGQTDECVADIICPLARDIRERVDIAMGAANIIQDVLGRLEV